MLRIAWNMKQDITPPAMAYPLPGSARLKRSTVIKLILAGILFLLVVISYLSGAIENEPSKAVASTGIVVLAMLIGIALILWDVRFGVAIFLVTSALSPRIGTNFRLTDFITPIMLLSWGGLVLRGQRATLRTPVTVPIVLVSLLMIGSTLYGLGIGMVPDYMAAVYIIGKRLEYFAIFFMALNVIQDRGWARATLAIFLLGALAGAMISLATAQADTDVHARRAVGLDEANYNTFAGFLTLAVGLSLAGALQAKNRILRPALGFLAVVFIVAMLKSYSREGYVILAVALIMLGVLRYRILLPILAISALVSPWVLPKSVIERAIDTVTQVKEYNQGDVGGNSFSARLSAWDWRLSEWFAKSPILGTGVGSIELSVDNEYVLRLCEGGTLGFLAFLILLASLWRFLARTAHALRGTELEPFAYGFLAAFVALIVQGTVAATFTTIRTMEPFWVIAGLLGGAVLAEANRLPAPETAHAEAAPAQPARSTLPPFMPRSV
ncbi:MAG: O-antigen ligase family protein [Chthonomonadales bacterium]